MPGTRSGMMRSVVTVSRPSGSRPSLTLNSVWSTHSGHPGISSLTISIDIRSSSREWRLQGHVGADRPFCQAGSVDHGSLLNGRAHGPVLPAVDLEVGV